MCVAVPVRLPHEGATREHWDRHRREHWDRHRSPFLRPYGGERCLSRCSRQICGLQFVILYVEGQICGLRFVILCVEGQICGLRFVILYVEGQIYGLRYVILYVEGQICEHWDSTVNTGTGTVPPSNVRMGGDDACPYVHGTVLVPMFTLSLCSRNGASLFTVRC